MKSLRIAIVACCAFLSFGPNSLAQNITGSPSLDIDQDLGMGTATCETDLDYDAQAYYAALVNCSVKDSDGNYVASGSYFDQDGSQGYAQVVLTFSGTPGVTYTATGAHDGEMYLGDYVGTGTRAITGFLYYDYYNFGSFEGSPHDYELMYDCSVLDQRCRDERAAFTPETRTRTSYVTILRVN